MSDTLVFIPAWNEEANLPAVLDALKAELPDADVLVVDDGSTDRTAEVALEHGATVLSLGNNLGLRFGIAAGYRYALEHDYAYCGRVDADGQHPPRELARLLALVRSGECDVAVGSRFVSGEGYPPYRYLPSPARRFGTAVSAGRCASRSDSRSATRRAGSMPSTRRRCRCSRCRSRVRAPEVEALVRISNAGLRFVEVPVTMEARASGESKLRGSKAVKLVLTVATTLLAAKLIRARR